MNSGRHSDTMYNIWLSFLEKYEFNLERLKRPREDGLLNIADIAMMMASKSTSLNADDIEDFLQNSTWTDSVEMDKISLLYSFKQAIEEQSAMTLIGEYLKGQTKFEGKEVKLVVDAKGTLRRSGSNLYLPVNTVAKKK